MGAGARGPPGAGSGRPAAPSRWPTWCGCHTGSVPNACLPRGLEGGSCGQSWACCWGCRAGQDLPEAPLGSGHLCAPAISPAPSRAGAAAQSPLTWETASEPGTGRPCLTAEPVPLHRRLGATPGPRSPPGPSCPTSQDARRPGLVAQPPAVPGKPPPPQRVTAWIQHAAVPGRDLHGQNRGVGLGGHRRAPGSILSTT